MADRKKFLQVIKDVAYTPIAGAVEPVEAIKKRTLAFVREALRIGKDFEITDEMKQCGIEGQVRVMILEHEQKHQLLKQLDRAERDADLEEEYGYNPY